MMQQKLAHAPSHTPRRVGGARRDNRLFATVVASTIAAVVVFSLFYAIGAVLGLALIGAVGAAMIAGLAWLSVKASRRRGGSRPKGYAPLA
jgi:predicted secreted protein